LNNGSKIIGEFMDISAPRSVLRLRNKREIRLSAIWMVNFEDRKWFFPEELKRIEKPEHYLFLKNDSSITGQIVDYNDRLKAFELDGGGTVEIGKLKRLYFSKTIPARLARTLKRQQKR